jgi:hypothetical protein
MLKDNLISQSICLIKNKQKHLKFLKDEVHYQRVEQQLNCKILQQRIERFQEKLNQEVCSNFPNAFWDRKTHVVKLPYVKDFNERKSFNKNSRIKNWFTSLKTSTSFDTIRGSSAYIKP